MGLPFRRCSARSQTTWDKLGICGRKCRGRRVKDLNIILRLGRNSPRESEYSCFPPVCLWYSSTCSLSAEPKTIGERAHGPLGMLAVPNSQLGQSSINWNNAVPAQGAILVFGMEISKALGEYVHFLFGCFVLVCFSLQGGPSTFLWWHAKCEFWILWL